MQPVFNAIKTPIWGIKSTDLESMLDQATPLLERAITPEDGYDLTSAANEIKAGRWQLWVIDDFVGIVITQILEYPLFKVLYVPWCAGTDVDSWIDDWIAVQEAYAAENGCKYVEFIGRPGWARFAKTRDGYKARRYLYRREV